ncbi:hypothetical protein F5Y19DRAFT_223584 [Xylariaceae sp. FL1651]|nr:hypothetical protein F5Y19DRAFT_223584 [Xylariaceae sp. FL1651]
MTSHALPNLIHLSPLEGYMPHAYVRHMYCFPTTTLHAVETLRQGLSGLTRDVPYILSRVISDRLKTGSGLALSTPDQSLEDIFSWHDLSASIDYVALKAAGFPPTTFQSPGIVPPGSQPPCPDPPAVFLARVSLVKGGLILCVAVHHRTTDITGFGSLLTIWASHCRNGSSHEIGFSDSWMDRGMLSNQSQILPGSDPIAIPDLLHVTTPAEFAEPAGRSQVEPINYQTGIFYFPQERLQALKEAVNAHLASREVGSWVSTSDVLSSLLWSAVIEATESSPAISSNGKVADIRTSTLSFPVQFRSILRPPLPQNYLGAAFIMTNAKASHADLFSISHANIPAPGQTSKLGPHIGAHVETIHIPALASTALAIRRSIKEIDNIAVRRVLSYLEAHPNPDPGAPLILGRRRNDPEGTGTSVVSWADHGIHKLDWGDTVGRCEAVRLPKMRSRRNPIVLPRVPGLNRGITEDTGIDRGGLEVIMSYEDSVMHKLIEGPVIKRLAVLRCLS